MHLIELHRFLFILTVGTVRTTIKKHRGRNLTTNLGDIHYKSKEDGVNFVSPSITKYNGIADSCLLRERDGTMVIFYRLMTQLPLTINNKGLRNFT